MFRVRRTNDEKYFYALGTHDARLVRSLGLLGLACTVMVFFGYVQFLHISPYLAVFFGPILVIILLYHVSQYFFMSLYPGFDVKRHRQKVIDYWHRRQRIPRIAVFVPAAGESFEIVRETLRAAIQIDYPNYRVFLLDDSKDGIYRNFSSNPYIGYIRRQNVGHSKKAGNMNHALGKIEGYEYVLVLDADSRARPEILRELVPYTAEDVGVVQSPQHFSLDKTTHARSKIEYGAAYIQKEFYQVTQVARNRFGAAICVGTNALYNVEALKRVDGFEGVGLPHGSHSEDVHTGIKMLNAYNPSDKRYRIIYVPIQLAKGICPDNHYSFYKQQNRWATGSMQLFFSGKTVFSDKMSPMQRVIYGSNSLYYYFTISLLLSPVYLLALALDGQQYSWAFTLYFLPSLVFNYLIEPNVLRRQRAPLAVSLVVISNAYTFLQAFVLYILRKPVGWDATGSNNKKEQSPHFTNFKIVATMGFIFLYTLTLGLLIMNERFQFGPSMFIGCLFLTSLLANIAFLFYVLIVGSSPAQLIKDRKFYAAVMLCALLAGVVFESYSYHSRYNIVLSDDRIRVVKQSEDATNSGGTLLDGYRRSIGDVKQFLHVRDW